MPLKIEYSKGINEFITKVIKDKTHYFLYLRVEINGDYLEITGYSLQALSNKDNDSLLYLYIYNSIDVFINIVFNNYADEIDNYSKVVCYINCFERFLFTYH
jgi:hypothetical protein